MNLNKAVSQIYMPFVPSHFEHSPQEKAGLTNGLTYKVLYFYLVFHFFSLERFFSHYSGIGRLNSIPTVIFYLLVLSWILSVSYKKPVIPLTKYLVLFIISMFLSTVFARNNGLPRLVFYPMINFFILYIIILSIIDNKEDFNKLIRLYIGSIVFLGIVGILLGGKIQFIPQLNDEDAVGPYMTMAIPFSWFLYKSSENKWQRGIYITIFILCISGVIVSFARGAFISMLVAFLYILYKSPTKMKSILWAIILVIIVGSITITYYRDNPYVIEMMTILDEADSNKKEGTGGARRFLWNMAYEMFKDNPLIGVGPLNYGVWLPEYAEKFREQQVGTARYGHNTHNIVMDALAEMGIFGIITYLMLNISFLKINHQTRRYFENVILEKSKNRDYQSNDNRLLLDYKKLYNISLAISGAYLVFLVNGFFYAIFYYDKFFLTLLLMNCALYVTARNVSLRELGATGKKLYRKKEEIVR